MPRPARIVAFAAVLTLCAPPAFTEEVHGPYAGAYLRLDLAPWLITRRIDGAAGGFVGYNRPIGHGLVAGGEFDLDYDWRNTNHAPARQTATGVASMRLGLDTGQGALIYARTGAGIETGGVGPVWELGGGLDLSLGESWFLRGDVSNRGDWGSRHAARTNIKVGIGVRF